MGGGRRRDDTSTCDLITYTTSPPLYHDLSRTWRRSWSRVWGAMAPTTAALPRAICPAAGDEALCTWRAGGGRVTFPPEGWHHPCGYVGTVQEILRVRCCAGVCRLPHTAVLILDGEDSAGCCLLALLAALRELSIVGAKYCSTLEIVLKVAVPSVEVPGRGAWYRGGRRCRSWRWGGRGCWYRCGWRGGWRCRGGSWQCGARVKAGDVRVPALALAATIAVCIAVNQTGMQGRTAEGGARHVGGLISRARLRVGTMRRGADLSRPSPAIRNDNLVTQTRAIKWIPVMCL
jgi:hypothetical protein